MTFRETGSDEDDQQIFVLLGREILGWGVTPPDISQFAIFYRPEGGGFVEQWPWAKLGVTPLAPGKPDLDHMCFFTQPRYSEDGMSAQVSFITKLVARDHRGRAMPPSIAEERLTLERLAGAWRLTNRTQGAIT